MTGTWFLSLAASILAERLMLVSIILTRKDSTPPTHKGTYKI